MGGNRLPSVDLLVGTQTDDCPPSGLDKIAFDIKISGYFRLGLLTISVIHSRIIND